MAEELLEEAPDSIYPHYALGTAFSRSGRMNRRSTIAGGF